jgi:hypothetical protein
MYNTLGPSLHEHGWAATRHITYPSSEQLRVTMKFNLLKTRLYFLSERMTERLLLSCDGCLE